MNTLLLYPETVRTTHWHILIALLILEKFMFVRYEKLQRWNDALKAYTAKAAQASSPHLVLEATLG